MGFASGIHGKRIRRHTSPVTAATGTAGANRLKEQRIDLSGFHHLVSRVDSTAMLLNSTILRLCMIQTQGPFCHQGGWRLFISCCGLPMTTAPSTLLTTPSMLAWIRARRDPVQNFTNDVAALGAIAGLHHGLGRGADVFAATGCALQPGRVRPDRWWATPCERLIPILLTRQGHGHPGGIHATGCRLHSSRAPSYFIPGRAAHS